MAIDSATSLASEVPIDVALENAETIIRSEFPDVSIPRDVLARAVELAPTKSKYKSAAYHALAKILRCDAPTLMAMLRADRKERRDVGKRS